MVRYLREGYLVKLQFDYSEKATKRPIHQFDLRPRFEKFFKILFYKIFDLIFGLRAMILV